jgi:thiosulfate dehydrogenase
MRGFILGFLATVVVIAAAGYGLLRSGLIPIGADAHPLPLERWAAHMALDAALKRDAPKGANPVALTDANLIAGIQLYGTHCAVCHGTAKGDTATSPIAKGENPPPPQLASEGVEDDPQGFSFWKIKHGIRWTGMPAWEKTLSDQQIWTIALFLKHMDKLPPAPQQVWQNPH